MDRGPQRLIVIGGGHIDPEFGQLFRRLWRHVTVIQSGKQLLPREDPEIADAEVKIVGEEGIEVLLNAHASSIEASKSDRFALFLICSINCSEVEVEGSHILLAPGRTPNTDELRLEKAGSESDARGHLKVSSTLQTSTPQIYALGNCHGGPAFTHISYDNFRIIKANFIDHSPSTLTTADRMVPYVIYIDPQLGHIGLHEAEAVNFTLIRTLKPQRWQWRTWLARLRRMRREV
ncbi:hypothetical protein LTR65_009330 [Meristemomyces frigidus]